MGDYEVTFTVPVEVTVRIEAADEEAAADDAWGRAEAHLDGLAVGMSGVAVHGSLDGIGAESVKEVGA